MHYQIAPHEESKVVRCTRGRVYDVLVDLRPGSNTFREWLAVELSADDRRMIYIPPDIAHGFQSLEDDSELFYQMSTYYDPASARGVRWNDEAFGIQWPIAAALISERDRTFPDFDG